jgi:hypothetical protein
MGAADGGQLLHAGLDAAAWAEHPIAVSHSRPGTSLDRRLDRLVEPPATALHHGYPASPPTARTQRSARRNGRSGPGAVGSPAASRSCAGASSGGGPAAGRRDSGDGRRPCRRGGCRVESPPTPAGGAATAHRAAASRPGLSWPDHCPPPAHRPTTPPGRPGQCHGWLPSPSHHDQEQTDRPGDHAWSKTVIWRQVVAGVAMSRACHAGRALAAAQAAPGAAPAGWAAAETPARSPERSSGRSGSRNGRSFEALRLPTANSRRVQAPTPVEPVSQRSEA